MPNFVSPHFAVPFRFGNSGHAECVEQDSHDDVYQCVQAIVRTVRGQRLELPDFGINDTVMQEGGPDVSDISGAIEQYEDRASYVIDVDYEEDIDSLMWSISIGVEGNDA
jgi:phage baseplate assembly protein W